MQAVLELGAALYLAGFRNRVMGVPISVCDLSSALPEDSLITGLVLDRIEYGDPAFSGPKQISLPLTVYVTTKDALIASGTAAPSDLINLPITILFNLAATAVPNGPANAALQLSVSYAGNQVPSLPLPGFDPAALSNLIDKTAGGLSQSVSIDLSGLNQSMNQPPNALPYVDCVFSATPSVFAVLIDNGGQSVG